MSWVSGRHERATVFRESCLGLWRKQRLQASVGRNFQVPNSNGTSFQPTLHSSSRGKEEPTSRAHPCGLLLPLIVPCAFPLWYYTIRAN